MQYHCGDCGTPLALADLDARLCPKCGATVSPFGDVLISGQRHPTTPLKDDPGATAAMHPNAPLPPITDEETLDDNNSTLTPSLSRLSMQERLEIARAGVDWPLATGITQGSQGSRTTAIGLVVGLGMAAIIVMVCGLTLVGTALTGATASPPTNTNPITIHTTPNATSTDAGLGFDTQVPNPTPLPFTQPIPTLEPTITPFGGPPTATPGSSAQSATLDAQINQKTACKVGNTMAVVISNKGDGTMTWQASLSGGGNIPIDNGMLSGGASQTIGLTGLTQNSSLTIAASDQQGQPAKNSPLKLDVSCG